MATISHHHHLGNMFVTFSNHLNQVSDAIVCQERERLKGEKDSKQVREGPTFEKPRQITIPISSMYKLYYIYLHLATPNVWNLYLHVAFVEI